ncbi:MAG TPA: cytochrome P450 [Opitutae bacterium]|nr:cytochrome [Myxococcales bacterium]HCR31006.1 cytochrome P450 [Opitutae bacterium]
MSEDTELRDPFKKPRQDSGVLRCPFQGEEIPMLLRHADVRKAAKDYQTYSSDAPFRVPIPSEEAVRSVRQLPIERDPPAHTDYRAIVEPFFQRAKTPEMAGKVEALIELKLNAAINQDTLEVVNEFALPIQSHALTYLLNVPETEAKTWIDWGIHVFKVTGGKFKKANVLEDYLEAQLDRAEKEPGEDFFSALTQAKYQGRKLTREEMKGFGNLTFAGGRDTIIHSICSILAYFGKNPEGLDFLREDPKRIVLAAEELFRVFMPLTHLGRVCPVETDVHGSKVPADGRVSLAWASANFDETVFEDAGEIRLDRKPNPHIAFGFGTHLCLGAPHARLIVRTMLKLLTEKVAKIEVLETKEMLEEEAKYTRQVGYEFLKIRLVGANVNL